MSTTGGPKPPSIDPISPDAGTTTSPTAAPKGPGSPAPKGPELKPEEGKEEKEEKEEKEDELAGDKDEEQNAAALMKMLMEILKMLLEALKSLLGIKDKADQTMDMTSNALKLPGGNQTPGQRQSSGPAPEVIKAPTKEGRSNYENQINQQIAREGNKGLQQLDNYAKQLPPERQQAFQAIQEGAKNDLQKLADTKGLFAKAKMAYQLKGKYEKIVKNEMRNANQNQASGPSASNQASVASVTPTIPKGMDAPKPTPGGNGTLLGAFNTASSAMDDASKKTSAALDQSLGAQGSAVITPQAKKGSSMEPQPGQSSKLDEDQKERASAGMSSSMKKRM